MLTTTSRRPYAARSDAVIAVLLWPLALLNESATASLESVSTRVSEQNLLSNNLWDFSR